MAVGLVGAIAQKWRRMWGPQSLSSGNSHMHVTPLDACESMCRSMAGFWLRCSEAMLSLDAPRPCGALEINRTYFYTTSYYIACTDTDHVSVSYA